MAEFPEVVSDAQAEKEDKKTHEEWTGLPGWILQKFFEAEHSRLDDEQRWLDAFRDFRGEFQTHKRLRDTEKSRVFIKIPKTKTLAAYGQLVEVVFAGNKFPIGIDPTEEPLGIAEKAHLDPEGTGATDQIPDELNVGFQGDGFDTAEDSVLRGLATKYLGKVFKPGASTDPKVPTIEPAREAADNMEKTIRDQLTESGARKELRSALFEAALYGTGIVKGPFNYDKTIHRWNIDTPEDEEEFELKRKYSPETTTVPKLEHVSIWNFYPDPNADFIEDCEYTIERHKLNGKQLRELLRRPLFNKAAIRRLLQKGPNWERRGYEDNLEDNNEQTFAENRFEVFEYWGYLDGHLAKEVGLDIPEKDIDYLDSVQVNAWVSGGEILRVVLNPFEPENIPYHVFPYERNPQRFFGIGVPENMSDSTLIMNGHARMAIDNLALSGNIIFDVDESALVPGQPFEIHPGKIFRRQSGTAGQAVYGIKIPNTTTENMQMFDKFRQLADEQTGIPSYSHGATGVQSTTRTASGMSMLMGAAALNIKTVVKNLDDYMLKPLATAFFYWNMQFNPKADIMGDVDVKALGTEAVMQKEVRSQRLMQFLQIAANPALAPFTKLHNVVKEIAISLDLEPDQIVNNIEEAQIFAQIIGNAGGISGEGKTGEQPNSMMGPNLGATGNGDGNIGTGTAPTPGEDEFSGRNNMTNTIP